MAWHSHYPGYPQCMAALLHTNTTTAQPCPHACCSISTSWCSLAPHADRVCRYSCPLLLLPTHESVPILFLLCCFPLCARNLLRMASRWITLAAAAAAGASGALPLPGSPWAVLPVLCCTGQVVQVVSSGGNAGHLEAHSTRQEPRQQQERHLLGAA